MLSLKLSSMPYFPASFTLPFTFSPCTEMYTLLNWSLVEALQQDRVRDENEKWL